MAALPEIEHISHLIENASPEVSKKEGGPVVVARIEGDLNLLSMVARYPRRMIGVEGRRLTTDLTTQRVLAVSDGVKTTALPYAEDVDNLEEPTREAVVRTLEGLNPRRAG